MNDEPQLPGEKVILEKPIVRGEHRVESVIVNLHAAGQLKGCSLRDLIDMDVGAMIIALPRCTQPPLEPHELALMNPFDFLALATELSNFLLPLRSRMASQTA